MSIFKALQGFSVLVAVVGFVACGKSGAAANDLSVKSSEFKIQGQDPRVYYKQFVTKLRGDCKNRYQIHYLNHSSVLIGKDQLGKDIRAEVAIFMNADGTYKAKYEEQSIQEYTESGYKFNILLNKMINGRWMVVENRIVFENLGEGSGFKYNDVQAIDFRFIYNVATAGLAGGVTILRKVHSDSVPNEIFEQLCGFPYER